MQYHLSVLSTYASCFIHCVSNDNKSQPLMASGGVDNCFLVCSNCDDDYEVDGDRQPMSLRCGHTFCLGSVFIGPFLLFARYCFVKIESVYNVTSIIAIISVQCV